MQGDARRLDGTFLNQELKRRTTSTQRNRMWDPSSRSSGDNKNINKNMSISNRNTVDNRQARSSDNHSLVCFSQNVKGRKFRYLLIKVLLPLKNHFH
ncbi:hypothetical protein LSM04_006896 [Trypanosoma melophagium]|uniref:uncharacterized protein n=1 Tax=Trypanosoma melophagium TaxID=715481 RepID=UPI00351A6946|nr:hypothetical protein LSM04_006896 [Trypanosoma melophagium]